VIRAGGFDLASVVAEAGVRCGGCGEGQCARYHAWRYRKPITDLSTGEVFEGLPILRVVFCDGSTRSLPPAEVWRGRFTVTSVLETVVRVLRDGPEATYGWTLFAGTGDQVVSHRSLRRWREIGRRRLVGSAWAWLGPQLGASWSEAEDPASQLERLLAKLTSSVLLVFRGVFGHTVLDKPHRLRIRARSSSRRVAGRLGPAAPHDPPSSVLPRGAWSGPRRRGPPGKPPREDRPP
jgi:hypothetical protein